MDQSQYAEAQDILASYWNSSFKAIYQDFKNDEYYYYRFSNIKNMTNNELIFSLKTLINSLINDDREPKSRENLIILLSYSLNELNSRLNKLEKNQDCNSF